MSAPIESAMFLFPMKSIQVRTASKPDTPPSMDWNPSAQPAFSATPSCTSSNTVVRLMSKIGKMTGIMDQKNEGNSFSSLALIP